MLIHSAVITGSVQFNNTDVSGITNVSGFATTASVDALVVKTGSFATTSSVNELQSKTGSYASTSSVNDLQSKTGSYTSTSSFDAYSSSINTFTSSATTRLNTIESVTGSFASTSSVNNLQSVTGSYASTGSNQFNGNQSISGSITSNGTITAQTLVVQTVTSSIEFVTGSTRNGSLSSNTHQFTGSVGITGSAAALLSVNNDVLYVSSSGNIGIGVTSISPISTYKTLEIRGATGGGIKIGKTGFNPLNIQHDGTDAYLNNVANGSFNIYTNDSPRLYISSSGNVGIGTSSPGYKLHVDGTGYFSSNLSSGGTISGGNLSTGGTLTGANLSINSAIYTYNITQYNYAASLAITLPNALTASSDNSSMRMYMVWVWGVNGYTEAGCRVWLIAMNGGGTAYTANEILGRDANGGTSLSIARTSASQITISSNNNAFIKFVSIMQLMTYANG
jgi:hypothetical protein